jgi:hypothetical protein
MDTREDDATEDTEGGRRTGIFSISEMDDELERTGLLRRLDSVLLFGIIWVVFIFVALLLQLFLFIGARPVIWDFRLRVELIDL